MVVLSAFLFLVRREVGHGFLEPFDLRQDFGELNSPHLFGEDVLVLVQEEHFWRGIHVKSGPEI